MFPTGPIPDLVDAFVAAEALGLDEVWLGDEGPAREPFSILAAASQHTTTIGLGIGITNPFVRSSALAITTALTVHEMSVGRMMLGVGAGGSMSLRPLMLQARDTVEHVEGFVATARAVAERRDGPNFVSVEHAIDASVSSEAMPIYVGGRGPAYESHGVASGRRRLHLGCATVRLWPRDRVGQRKPPDRRGALLQRGFRRLVDRTPPTATHRHARRGSIFGARRGSASTATSSKPLPAPSRPATIDRLVR